MSSIFDRFELESFKRMYANAKAVHDYSHKNMLFILCDMAYCILHDHVGYMEYNLFHFVNKSKEDRATYVTFDYSQNLFKTLNEKDYIDTFNDKLKFNEIYKEELGRAFLNLNEADYVAFEKFCENKSVFFCKPADSCSGQGIYKNVYLEENSDLKKIYEELKENHLFIEESIVQEKKMASLHPSSINTVRITTLLDKNNKAHVMYAILRIGTENRSVDNVGAGGIYTVLSEEGKITCPCWSDKTISTYTKHPTTGVELIGFEVPYFEQAKALCNKAAEKQEHIRYVGWDVAITEKGPVIVEGNPLPGYDMPQNYFVTGKDTGLKPDFERILDD